jgi:hypothetical protein
MEGNIMNQHATPESTYANEAASGTKAEFSIVFLSSIASSFYGKAIHLS